jgi:SAM-dependent methyltransferase
VADTSSTFGPGKYSYFQKEFVSFYDQMVLECFGGTKADDVKAYSTLLQQLLLTTAPGNSGRDLVVVDLGCGSGRATLAFLEHLAPMIQPEGKHLYLYGVDNSAVFLEAAKPKCDAFLQQHATLRSWVTVDWLLGSFEAWELPRAPHQQNKQKCMQGLGRHIQSAETEPASAQQPQHTHADLILVAGSGLHHVTSTTGLSTALRLAAQRLSPGGICVLSYLPWAELYRQDNSGSSGDAAGPSASHTVLTVEEFRVQGFRWVDRQPLTLAQARKV